MTNETGVIIVITVNAIFIAFILAKKAKSLADYLLIVLNALMSALVFVNSVQSEDITTGWLFLQSVIPLLIFPAFFLFVISYINKGMVPSIWYLMLLLPFSFSLFYYFDHYVVHTYDHLDLVGIYNAPPISYHVFYKLNQLISISLCIYLIGRLKVYENEIRSEFSFIDLVESSWIKHSLWVFLVMSSLSLLLFLSINLNLLPFDIDTSYIILNASIAASMIYINFRGIQHYSADKYLALLNQKESESRVSDSIKTKESKEEQKLSDVNKERLEAIYHQIIEIVEGDQLYLRKQLKLKDLVEQVGETSHLCSSAINVIGNISFYDLINEYRIAHFKKQLASPDNSYLTILAIGLASGFNSKASLNRIFKSKEGLSPIEYKKSLAS